MPSVDDFGGAAFLAATFLAVLLVDVLFLAVAFFTAGVLAGAFAGGGGAAVAPVAVAKSGVAFGFCGTTPTAVSASRSGPCVRAARFSASDWPILTTISPIIRAVCTWLRPRSANLGNRSGPSKSRPIGAYTNASMAWSIACSRGDL